MSVICPSLVKNGDERMGGMAERAYKVRWIVAPRDQDRAGMFGTTTHPSRTPAAAALASAESVMAALSDEDLEAQFHVLSVSAGDMGHNLLSSDDLRAALRYHDRNLPIEVLYRPLC
jgi:hypothetical protein